MATRTSPEVCISGAQNAPIGALKLTGACAYLGGLSKPTLHRLVKRGLIRPNRSTRHLLFSVAELERFLKEGQS